jgi:hypothetical protein
MESETKSKASVRREGEIGAAEADPLRLAYVEERAARYQLNIPEKIECIEVLASLVYSARRSYLEDTSKT